MCVCTGGGGGGDKKVHSKVERLSEEKVPGRKRESQEDKRGSREEWGLSKHAPHAYENGTVQSFI